MILIVEDESDIRSMIRLALTKAGLKCLEAEDAETALTMLDKPGIDMLLIDWMLPGMSGIDLARRLRLDDVYKKLPLLMLTARGEEHDKLRSFDVGIDDYITKPFSPRELVARIKAIRRRASPEEENNKLVVGELCLDTQAQRLLISGEDIHIGPTEYRLLEHLMRNPDRVFTREQLLDRVWGRDIYVEDRTVDVHVLRLRKLLSPKGYAKYVQTVRGTGYRFSRA